MEGDGWSGSGRVPFPGGLLALEASHSMLLKISVTTDTMEATARLL